MNTNIYFDFFKNWVIPKGIDRGYPLPSCKRLIGSYIIVI